MKRIELFEFEDFSGLPNVIRTGVTNLIIVFHKLIGTKSVLTNLIIEISSKIKFTKIIDMGSGSGGPMIEVIQELNTKNKSKQRIELVLSDKFPNKEIITRINNLRIPNVYYLEDSVDASKMETLPKGLKTMIASFHHMSPKLAKAILSSAARSKEPILIYELAENNIPVLIWVLLLPLSLSILILMSLIMTFFVRPLTFSQLFFTFIIPIIPLIYAWDGQASLMRTYTFNDIKELLGDYSKGSYTWEIEQAKKQNGKKAGYYIFGYNKE